MTMKGEDGEVCEYCKVVVDCEGTARATYKWRDNPGEGTETHDEDVSDWTDVDIQSLFAELVGIVAGDEEIQVTWE